MSNLKDRVLGRMGARELNVKENIQKKSGVGTQTLCTFDPQFGPDGDVGECS
jgi:hypothetical protein